MNDLFAFAAHNTVAAVVLACLVFVLTRRRRNPPLAHALWLLVLLKLVAPPVVHFEWPSLNFPRSEARATSSSRMCRDLSVQRLRAARELVSETSGRPLPAMTTMFRFARMHPGFRDRAPLVFIWLWLGGAVLYSLIAVARIIRFERLLRGTLPPSTRLERLADQVAARLGVRRVPAVRYLECAPVPFLWCAGGRPMVVLPANLPGQFDDQSLALILGHELAHLRRRDHWVRCRTLRFDRLLVESTGLVDSTTDSRGRRPLLRRVGSRDVSRLRKATPRFCSRRPSRSARGRSARGSCRQARFCDPFP